VVVSKEEIMDNKLKEVLVTIGLTTFSVLLALKIKEWMNSARTLPPQKVEN
jgi:hypothetical protein